MRPIFKREFIELLIPGLAALVAAVIGGCATVGRRSNLEEELILLILCAGGVGIAQGIYDRLRREDFFQLHRPQSSRVLEAARTLAGFAWIAVIYLGFLAAHHLTVAYELSHRAELVAKLARYLPFSSMPPPERYAADVTFVLGAISLASWAVGRLAAGFRGLGWVPFSLAAFPVTLWALASRHETDIGIAVFCLGAACVLSVGTMALQAGSRS